MHTDEISARLAILRDQTEIAHERMMTVFGWVLIFLSTIVGILLSGFAVLIWRTALGACH